DFRNAGCASRACARARRPSRTAAGSERSSLTPDLTLPQGSLRGPFSFAKPPVKRRPRLTRARLRELLHYNKKTGEFRWRERTGNGVRRDLSAGHLSGRGHLFISIDQRVYAAHQLAWFYVTGRWGKPEIDHRDGD